MSYSIKEMFLTLQGEGARAGRVAVFCRFAGCNLWTGREEDRESADCWFCDTDFLGTDGVGGGRFESATELADEIAATWGARAGRPYVVFTGGEPALQLDAAVVDACHARGFEIAVETNGTVPLPRGIDWITVSPKGRAPLQIRRGNELKLVYPQGPRGVAPESVADLDFAERFLQPRDGTDRERNTAAAIEYCREHPGWRLSVQVHKLAGFP